MKHFCRFFALIIIASLLIGVGCVKKGDVDSLSVQSIEVMKTYGGVTLEPGETIQPGESINVEAVVNNTGNSSGSFTIQLEINDEVRDSHVAPLNPGEQTHIIFTLSFDKAGSYKLSILGSSVTVEVLPDFVGITPAGTTMYIPGPEGKSEYPTELMVGEEGIINLVIENHEGQETSYHIEVTMEGIKVRELGPLTLANDEEIEEQVVFVPQEVGYGQELLFLLYRDSGGEPYLTLRLSVDVLNK